MTRWVLLLCLLIPSSLFAQTIIPPRVELSPEAYQAILDQAKKHTQDLEGFIAEMLVYKYDTDGQLGDQYSRLDEGKADRKSIADRHAALQRDYESWRAQFIATDKGHDAQLSQLFTKAGELSNLIQGLRSDLNGLSTSVGALATANQRQDQRMDRMDARAQDLETYNRNQDSATEALRTKLSTIEKSQQGLTDRLTSQDQAISRLTAETRSALTTIAGTLKAIEDRLAKLEAPKELPPVQPQEPTP